MAKLGAFLFLFLLSCSVNAFEERSVIFFNSTPLYVEIAITNEQQQQGLMNREDMDEDAGMIFVFEKPARYAFWMKDTYIPLSIAFLSPEGKILDIQDMEPLNEKKRYRSPRKTLYAIEVNQGWFLRNDINVGDIAQLPVLQDAA